MILFGLVLFFSLILIMAPVVFKIAAKLRLIPALIYVIVVYLSTFFSDWANQNKQLVIIGLYILIGISIVSWIYSFVNYSRKH